MALASPSSPIVASRFGSNYAFRSKNDGHHALDTLLFFLRHHQLKHTDYLQSARRHQVPVVTLPDHKLCSTTCSASPPIPSIDRSVKFEHPSQPFDEYRPEDVAQDPGQVPASQILDTADYVSMIRALERSLKDHEALMEAKNRDFYAVLVASTKREEEGNRAEAQQRKDGIVAKTM